MLMIWFIGFKAKQEVMFYNGEPYLVSKKFLLCDVWWSVDVSDVEILQSEGPK